MNVGKIMNMERNRVRFVFSA